MQPFEKLSEMAKNIQGPFQAIAELNVKTLQSLSYLKPEELSKLKKPEEILEKQMNLMVENGHKALNYWQELFEITENSAHHFLQNVKGQERQERHKRH